MRWPATPSDAKKGHHLCLQPNARHHLTNQGVDFFLVLGAMRRLIRFAWL
jgi:hypothetical protein